MQEKNVMTMHINELTHIKQETKHELKQNMKEIKKKQKQVEGEEMFIKKCKVEIKA
jgi:hypothetical protein